MERAVGSMLRGLWVLLLVAVGLSVPSASAGVHAPSGLLPSPPECDPEDRPETGIQGEVPLADQLSGRSQQGYWCNMRPVGSNDLGGLGGDIQMAWYDHCAYQGAPRGGTASDGVGVLDLTDPADPKLVTILRESEWAGRGGVLGIHEGLHVSQERGVLVVPIGWMISVYDVSENCREPVLKAHFEFSPPGEPLKGEGSGAAGIHSGKVSPDGTWYYATDIGNGAVSPTGPCLTVIDLADLTDPKLVMRWGAEFPCHDLGFNEDGTRAYVGYYASGAGHPAAVIGAFTPLFAPAHLLSGLLVLDTSEVQDRVPDPDLRILGELAGGRQHTQTFARIGDRAYVIAAEEAFCPGGNGRIVDVTDDRNPVEVSEITLGVNRLPTCPAAQADPDARILNYMSHYVSVDDPADATLAFFTWYSSGLRVFDIRDPANPFEVAYFNPPVGEGHQHSHDWSTTYPSYVPETGHVWFGSAVNGLNVVELAPELRPGVPGAEWSVDPWGDETIQARAGSGAPALTLTCTIF